MKSKCRYMVILVLLVLWCSSVWSSSLDFLFTIPKDISGVNLEGVKDVCIDEYGNLYVTKAFSEYVFKLSKDGKLLNKIGQYGIEEGEFIIPDSVAIKDNYLYVADVGRNKVNIFEIIGDNIKFRIPIETALGENLGFISDIVVDKDSNLYIADKGNNRVIKFDKYGNVLTKFIISNISARYIALDEGGNNLFVVDDIKDKIEKFDKDTGTHLLTFSDPDLKNISGIAFNPKNQRLYVAYDKYKLKVFDRNGGIDNNIVINTYSGFGPLAFGNIKKMRFDSKGDFLYIVDNKNGCIQKLSYRGEFQDVFASFSFKEGYFYEPTQMAVDKSGNLYVIDSGNKRVQKFNQDGIFIKSFADGYNCEDIAIHHQEEEDRIYLAIPLLPGQQIGGIEVYTPDGTIQTIIPGSDQTFSSPQAIAVNEKLDKIYLIDGEFSRKLLIFNKNFYTKEKEISLEGICTDIAIDAEDRLYIVDNTSKYIKIYDKDGEFIKEFGGEGDESGKFKAPYGISISKEKDLIYIADAWKDNIYIFSGYKMGNIYIREVLQENQVKGPKACTIYKNRLYIADTGNHRILVYGKEGSGSSDESARVWNYPNPFDPNDPNKPTTIKAKFTKNVNKVIIRIYNILGELVWEHQKIGYFPEGEEWELTQWDGKDLWNRKVADGVYICLLEAEGQKATNKILVIKDAR